jgi:Undecaprenyl-phosphate glucose phosphotransferase
MDANKDERGRALPDVSSTGDVHLDVPWKEQSCPIVHRGYISLAQWVAMLAVSDVIGMALIALIVFLVYARPLDYDVGQFWAGLAAFLVGWMVAAWAQSLYCRETLLSGARMLSLNGLVACALTFGIVLLLGFSFKFIGNVSRVWLLTWAMGSFVWISGLRLLWAYCLSRSLNRGKCLDRALVLAGSTWQASRSSDDIERESRGVIAVVSAGAIPGTPDGVQIGWIEEAIRTSKVDRIIIAKFEGVIEQSRALLARLMQVAVDVTFIPDLAELRSPMLKVDRIGTLPAIGFASRPLSAIQATVKRAEDLSLSCFIMLLATPLLVVIALAIKLDSSGPILFGQLREGYHNRVFKVWKFRTMFHEARDERAVQQTSRQDPRVTRVGALLRRLSLDELPQFINVIQGEMSIVGPRPHALGMTSVGLPMTEVLEAYTARHRLKPGITGWAQVNGCRGEVDSHDKLRRRVSLDCYYIDNWSLGLDLWIVLRTLTLLVFDRDAY